MQSIEPPPAPVAVVAPPDVPKSANQDLRRMLLDGGALTKAVERLLSALDAVFPNGQEDHRSRLAAAAEIMNRIDGKPVERVHRIDEKRKVPSVEAMLESPAAREALRDALAKADKKPARPVKVPVEASPED